MFDYVASPSKMALQRLEIVRPLHQALHDSKHNKPVGAVSMPIWTIATGTVNYDMIITKGTVRFGHRDIHRQDVLRSQDVPGIEVLDEVQETHR